MARVIVGDQLLPAKVVFVSHHLQIWIVADVYKLFVGDQSLSVLYCMAAEAVKPAFMRKKVSQGRNTDSQGDAQK